MSIKIYSSTSREYHLFHRQLCKHRTFLSLNCFNRCNGKTWYPILFIFIAPISSDFDNFLTYPLLLYLHYDFCEFINGIFSLAYSSFAVAYNLFMTNLWWRSLITLLTQGKSISQITARSFAFFLFLWAFILLLRYVWVPCVLIKYKVLVSVFMCSNKHKLYGSIDSVSFMFHWEIHFKKWVYGNISSSNILSLNVVQF